MPINIHSDLNPLYETINLLYFSHWLDGTPAWLIRELDKIGVDGPSFYARHSKVFEKYVRVFDQHRVEKPEEAFFFQRREPVFFMLVSRSATHTQELLISDETQQLPYRLGILRAYNEMFELVVPKTQVQTMDGLVEFVENSAIPEASRWDFLQLLTHPRKYLSVFHNMLHNNLPAYKKARSALKKPITDLLLNFIQSEAEYRSKNLVPKEDTLTDIYPSLALPFAQLRIGDICYYGLFFDDMLQSVGHLTGQRETLINRFKALGDKSKLEIMLLLTKQPRYSLEISRETGLTAATVSYHMNALLNCGLVSMEKHEQRIYYSVRSEGVRWMIEETGSLLLGQAE